MKIDPADHILGQRINVWVALAALLTGITWFLIAFHQRRPGAHPDFSPETRPTIHGPRHRLGDRAPEDAG